MMTAKARMLPPICVALCLATTAPLSAQLRSSRTLTSITSVYCGRSQCPDPIRLSAGQSMNISLRGQGLGELVSGAVVAGRYAVSDVTVTLGTTGLRGTSRAVTLTAAGSAASASGLGLRFTLRSRTAVAAPVGLSVIAQSPSVSRVTPSQVTLEPEGPPVTVTLTGQLLNELTGAQVEVSGSSMNGRVNATLQPSRDPTRRDVSLVAFANAGPPWGSTMQLAIEGTGGVLQTLPTTSLSISVPAPPVDLEILDCSFENPDAPERGIAHATVRNSGTEGVAFEDYQVVAKVEGLDQVYYVRPPPGGRYYAAGETWDVHFSLEVAGLPPGPYAVIWTLDSQGLVLESNERNNRRWCPFERGTTLPNLVVTSVSVNPGSAVPDAARTASVVIRNVGATTVGRRLELDDYMPRCVIDGAFLPIKNSVDYWWISPTGQTISDPLAEVNLSEGQSGTFVVQMPTGFAPGSKVLGCKTGYLELGPAQASTTFTVTDPIW